MQWKIIEHILITLETRDSHSAAHSLRAFQEVSLEKIFNFLKEIYIFDKI